jgi:hypothetical protein
MYMIKICSKCGKEKPVEEFYVRKDSKDGYRNDCIDCVKEQKIKYNGRYKDRVSKWYYENKEITIQRSKEWKENNLERNRELNKQSDKRRRPLISKYRRERYHSDNLFRLRDNIAKLIGNSFRKKSYSKKSKTNQILGIDYDGFMKHIESQFVNGMSWDNRGEWELDHIIPVSLGKSEEEIIRLNHYSNFRPLWRKDNLLKSNTILDEDKHLVEKYIS